MIMMMNAGRTFATWFSIYHHAIGSIIAPGDKEAMITMTLAGSRRGEAMNHQTTMLMCIITSIIQLHNDAD